MSVRHNKSVLTCCFLLFATINAVDDEPESSDLVQTNSHTSKPLEDDKLILAHEIALVIKGIPRTEKAIEEAIELSLQESSLSPREHDQRAYNAQQNEFMSLIQFQTSPTLPLPKSLENPQITHVRSMHHRASWLSGCNALFNTLLPDSLFFLGTELEKPFNIRNTTINTFSDLLRIINFNIIDYRSVAFEKFYHEIVLPILNPKSWCDDDYSTLLRPDNFEGFSPETLAEIADTIGLRERLYILAPVQRTKYNAPTFCIQNTQNLQQIPQFECNIEGTQDLLHALARCYKKRNNGDIYLEPLHFICLTESPHDYIGSYVLISIIQDPLNQNELRLIYMDSANKNVVEQCDSYYYITMLYNIFISSRE